MQAVGAQFTERSNAFNASAAQSSVQASEVNARPREHCLHLPPSNVQG
jgi:hypothetical protein